MIRELTRPIGEIARLIQQNIQLVEKFKQNDLGDLILLEPKKLPQKVGKIIMFDYPRTVCTSKKCTQIITVDDEKTVDYNTHCHLHCYLRDVERECIGHSGLRYCSAMNQNTRLCEKCECCWRKHMHITYEYQLSTVYIEINSSNITSSLAAIDKHISDLRDE